MKNYIKQYIKTKTIIIYSIYNIFDWNKIGQIFALPLSAGCVINNFFSVSWKIATFISVKSLFRRKFQLITEPEHDNRDSGVAIQIHLKPTDSPTSNTKLYVSTTDVETEPTILYIL